MGMNDTYPISPFKRIRFVKKKNKQTNKQINLCCVVTFLNREQKVVLSHCFRPIISSFSFHFRSSYIIYFIYHPHSFLSREHMNPQLTYSQRQWLHSSVGRASHRYREVTGSNPVEVLNFFQASLRNCINCVYCDDHFFIFS